MNIVYNVITECCEFVQNTDFILIFMEFVDLYIT